MVIHSIHPLDSSTRFIATVETSERAQRFQSFDVTGELNLVRVPASGFKTMSQPRIVPVEKSFQQHLSDAIHFIEKNYGLDAQTLAVALAVVLVTIGKCKWSAVK